MIEDPAAAALGASLWLRDEVLPLAAGRRRVPSAIASQVLAVLGPAIARAPAARRREHEAALTAALYGGPAVAVRAEDLAVLVAVLEQCATRIGELQSRPCASNKSSSRSSPPSAPDRGRLSGVTTRAPRATVGGGS